MTHASGGAARLVRAGRTIRGTAAGLASVLRLSWAVSAPLTAGLAVVTVAIGLVPALTTYLTSVLVDTVAGAADDAGVRQWITVLAGLMFAVFAASAASSAAYGIVGRLLEERVGFAVQLRIMSQASRLELAFFEDSRSYDLLREAQHEASSRPAAMVSNAFGQLQLVVTFASMVALLAGLNPLLALLALVTPVPAFVSDARFGRRMFGFSRWAAPVRRRMQYLTDLVTTDTAAKEVKLFGLGGHFVERFRTMGEDLYRRQRRLVITRNLSYAGWGLLTTATTALTYLYVALQAAGGRLGVGDLVLFGSALTAVQSSVQSLLRGVTAMYEDNLYLSRLHLLLAIRPATSPVGPVRSLPDPPRGHLVFEHVSFRYPGSDTLALDDVSVEIRPGETLAVVGRNGAGKSTLVKLLCRLYDPAAGRILLDGVDLRELDQDRLHAMIGALFQDHVTYQATAAENIGLGNLPDLANRAKIVDSARQGGADALVEALPHGYDTQLGKWFDDGVELSGGEWQKIALSRAFMRDALILILDEPTSALDAAAEHELFERLRCLARGRTTVYVSHRFSTVRRADRVLLLDAGKVAEHGSHDELIRLGGEYAQLFALQALAYLDEPEAPWTTSRSHSG